MKILSAAQAAIKSQALRFYSATMDAAAVPRSKAVGVPRCEVNSSGEYRTVYADGSVDPWQDIRTQWKAYLRERDKVIGATLHDEIWKRFNRK
jgi:hypothetical protein